MMTRAFSRIFSAAMISQHLVSRHPRHHDVEEHEVDFLAAEDLERAPSIRRRGSRGTHLAGPGRPTSRLTFSSSTTRTWFLPAWWPEARVMASFSRPDCCSEGARDASSGGHGSKRVRRGSLGAPFRNEHAEGGALSRLALEGDLPSHALDELRGDREPEAHAALGPRLVRAALNEGLEDLLVELGGDAASRVPHADLEARPAARSNS